MKKKGQSMNQHSENKTPAVWLFIGAGGISLVIAGMLAILCGCETLNIDPSPVVPLTTTTTVPPTPVPAPAPEPNAEVFEFVSVVGYKSTDQGPEIADSNFLGSGMQLRFNCNDGAKYKNNGDSYFVSKAIIGDAFFKKLNPDGSISVGMHDLQDSHGHKYKFMGFTVDSNANPLEPSPLELPKSRQKGVLRVHVATVK